MRRYRFVILLVLSVVTALFSLGLFGLDFSLNELFGDGFKDGCLYLFNAIAFAGILLAFSFSMISGRVKGVAVLKKSAVIALDCVAVAVVGTLAAWLMSRYASVALFKAVTYFLMVLILALCTYLYLVRRKRYSNEISVNSVRRSAVSNSQIKFGFMHLFASLLVFIVVGGVYLFISGDNLFFLVVLLQSFLGLLAWKFFKWRGWLLITFLFILSVLIAFVKVLIIGYFSVLNATDFMSFVEYGLIFGLVALTSLLSVSFAALYSHKEVIS